MLLLPSIRTTHGYLPSCTASPPFDQQQIVLLGDSHISRYMMMKWPRVEPTTSQLRVQCLNQLHFNK